MKHLSYTVKYIHLSLLKDIMYFLKLANVSVSKV